MRKDQPDLKLIGRSGAPPPGSRGREVARRIPIRGAHRAMVEHMRRSQGMLLGTTMYEGDATGFVSFWEESRRAGRPVSYAAMFLKALSYVLTQQPIFNSTLEENTIAIFRDINIGFAVYANSAFYVPVIREAPAKDVFEISREMERLAGALAVRSLLPEETAGATFTMNYMGGFLVDGFTGFVSQSQTSFLGIGRMRREPGLDEEDQLIRCWRTTLSLTADRSVVTGVPIANFMEQMQEVLTTPASFLYSK